MRARELRAHVDHAALEVNVAPREPEELRDPQPGVESGRDHQPVARRASPKQPLDLSDPMELGGLEPPTSWVRFRKADYGGRMQWMSLDIRRFLLDSGTLGDECLNRRR